MPVLADETTALPNAWIEAQTFSTGLSKVTGVFDGSLTKDFGYYIIAHQSSNGYREIYGGPRWKTLPWLELGVGMGRETDPGSIRRNLYFSIGYERLFAVGTFENGGSGPWHRIDMMYRLPNKFSAGVTDETGFGLGPRLEYSIKKDVSVWGAFLHNGNTRKTVSTLAINFML